MEGHLLTGNAASVVSGRVSYVFGLEGPAVSVDTACSSSLVALHLASQALRSGECTLALAGGVTVMATPGAFAGFAAQGGLAGDGRCKAFAASADGTGWGEGAGVLVLERLSEARRRGHRVLAVVAGSAVNQDGASNGLTAPNGPSQQRVIRTALANARVSAADVDVVEAHGTGTRLGDPIEAQALLATYGQQRPDDRPLWLGSVKSNIGHTQAAAGVAGVIKMVLALRHAMLPATLHVDAPSPHVDWSAGQVRLLTEAVAWPSNGRPRRAGVSSFGISGTNAHVILEESPPVVEVDGPDGDDVSGPQVLAGVGLPVVWVVSAKSVAGLAGQAGRLAARLAADAGVGVVDVAWSLAATRSVFEYRGVVVGADREGLLGGLVGLGRGERVAGVVAGVAGGGRTVFVFPGQGGQWVGMGRELLAVSPVFAARLAECELALAPFVDWSLSQVLAGAVGAPGLAAVEVVQPVLWAVMVSLAAVWQAAGVVPDVVVGHSQGEIAAACVAGALSLADGARVVALRSRALAGLPAGGGMVSVAEPAERVRQRLAGWGDRLSVAVVNGPASTVVAGDDSALVELLAVCKADRVRVKRLEVGYASHSVQVEQLRDEILAVLKGIKAMPGRVAMISAMTGEFLDATVLDAQYWYDSLRAPVEFDRAVRVLVETGYDAFIEVSPHPVLTTAIGSTVEDVAVAGTVTGPAPVVTGTLRRGDGGASRLLASLAQVYVRGVRVDWAAVFAGRDASRVDLPTYAFQHQRYWPRPAPAPASVSEGGGTVAEARFWAAVEDGDVRELAHTLAMDGGRLGEVLPALASWRRRERDDAVLAGWRYRVCWVAVADPAPVVLPGTWLVLVAAGRDQDEVTGWCVRALSVHGARVVLMQMDTAAPDRLAFAAQIGQVLQTPADVTQTELAGGSVVVGGVVSLLALQETPLPGVPAVPGGLAATLVLVQALGDVGLDAPLWVLTQGAVTAGPDEVLTSPVQAQVWGLGRVAGLEHPDRWGGLLDLPARFDERAGQRLCAVLAGCGEDQSAVRPAGIMARRLVRAAARSGQGSAWTPRGTVLVTGGTGAIGTCLAWWLAERGAPRVVLTSRSGPTAAGIAGLAARLAAAGTRVCITACDVAQRTALTRLLAGIDAGGPPLSAVMHAAITYCLTPVDEVDVDELVVTLSGKVTGARLLDELTAGMSLDAFVLFSSITGTWGGSDHGVYAAANAYLDALAQDRRARGLPGTSVAWGVWDTGSWLGRDVVSPVASGSASRLRRQGFGFLNPGLALTALGQVLTDDEVFLAVADVDWVRFAPVFNAARAWRLLQEIPEVRQLAAAVPVEAQLSVQAGALAARLAAVTPGERELVVTDLVRAHAAAVLGHVGVDEVSAGRAFREMGFDSLTAVELRDRLNTAVGLRLPSTVVFDYPSPVALGRQIAQQLLGITPVVEAVVASLPALGDPVVIVGMGCRFPGGVASPQQLWQLLTAGGDAISGAPVDRGWDAGGVFDADPGGSQGPTVIQGGFLHDAAGFDAGFFGISPREALAMDPQQRLLLEVCWEALEDAGIDPVSLRGTTTGVFAGTSGQDYGALAGTSGHAAEVGGHLLTGNAASVVSGRVSYVLGLEGPAVSVDTACSSSLVALHLASQALRAGECTMALTGGVLVMATPTEFAGFSAQGGLAADGRCKAFAAAADGMGLAEGVGVLVLERLSEARRRGHRVLAVVAGSAVNQDGASNGLTAPNGPSQQRVIRTALANARVSPRRMWMWWRRMGRVPGWVIRSRRRRCWRPMVSNGLMTGRCGWVRSSRISGIRRPRLGWPG